MKIVMAEHAGFCFGVQGAVEKVFNHSKKGEKLTVLGQLIHNRHVSRDLANAGVGTISNTHEATIDETVVIRTHGATKETYNELNNRNINTIDATCPYVTKVQVVAKKFDQDGFNVVLFGERGHPEVTSIVSYLGNTHYVVETVEEAKELPHMERYALVSQTTQSKVMFPEVADVVRNKCNHFTLSNTICNATELRQNSAVELAKEADTMVVIGGRNSGNTQRLVKTCEKYCNRVFHIESVEDLTKDLFISSEFTGVTAGASTPDYIISEVMTFLEGM